MVRKAASQQQWRSDHEGVDFNGVLISGNFEHFAALPGRGLKGSNHCMMHTRENKISIWKQCRVNAWDGIGVTCSAAMRGTAFVSEKYIMPEKLQNLVKRMQAGEELPVDKKPVIIDAR